MLDPLMREPPRNPTRVAPELMAALGMIEPLPERLGAAVRPRPGSLADGDQRQRVGLYTLELATPALGIGVEHLAAWRALALDARWLPAYPFLSLLRVSIECGALARWLLEPGIDRDVRRRRGMGAQWVDYDERRKFENVAKVYPDPPGRSAHERQRDLETVAKRHGLPLIKPSPSTRLAEQYVLPATPPDDVKLGEMLYRVLSGAVHGRQWTLMQGAREIGHDRWGRTTINQGAATSAILVAAHVCMDALLDLERYTGATSG